ALVEVGKHFFFRRFKPSGRSVAIPRPHHERKLHRRAAGWSAREPVRRPRVKSRRRPGGGRPARVHG
ncbi:MAG TPA: hypothetical protein VII83_08855, partial [Gaiellaceae bacterium]